VDDIVASLQDFRSYMPESVTAEKLATLAMRRGKNVDVLVEWFRVEEDEAPLPKFDPATGSLQGGRKGFKPVREAKDRLVETGGELKKARRRARRVGLRRAGKAAAAHRADHRRPDGGLRSAGVGTLPSRFGCCTPVAAAFRQTPALFFLGPVLPSMSPAAK
jgi:hypothetical protein